MVQKIGARNNRSDAKRIQDMHDNAVALGATCNGVEKHAPAPPVESRIVKADDEQRMVYGWASVISENGVPHVDTQGDVIDGPDLVKATTDFMKSARLAKAMHEGEGVGEVLHSFPLTTELAKSLGLDADREGWLVGVHVPDDATWARVKSGELGSFSIGGFGERIPIEEAA